jgi:hypothetical protein
MLSSSCTLRLRGRRYRVRLARDEAHRDAHTLQLGAWLIADAVRCPQASRSLARFLSEVDPWRDASVMSTREIATTATRLLDVGAIEIDEEAEQRVMIAPPVEEPVLPSDLPTEEETDHWIEIELVDPDGRPVPNQRFELSTEDGERTGGRLDDRGFARVERLRTTSYQIRFPDVPGSAWQQVGA